MKRLIERNTVAAYFVAAFLISGGFVFLPVAESLGWVDFGAPDFFGMLAAIGPSIAAVLVTGILDGRAGIRKLFSSLAKRPLHIGYFLFALGVPLLMLGVGFLAAGRAEGALEVAASRTAQFLPVFALLLVVVGLGEELGWRGFAQVRLQAHRRPVAAALIVGCVWACWHLPLFLMPDSLQGKLWEACGIGGLLGYSMFVACTALLYGWVLNASGSSVLMPAVMHASTNALSWLFGLDEFGRFGPQPILWFAGLQIALGLALAIRSRDLGLRTAR